MLLSGIITIQRLWTDPNAPDSAGAWIRFIGTRHAGALGFLIADVFIFIGVATLTGMQATQIARNITTNELTNAMRYSYLKRPDGRFHNPYDHGCRKNCSDFLIQGYNEDINLPWQPLQQNGVGMVQLMQKSGSSSASTSTSVNVMSSSGSNANHHQHSSACNHSNHGHSSNFVPLGLGLGLTHKAPGS